MNEKQSTLTTGHNEPHSALKQAIAIDIQDLVVKYGSKRAVDGLTFTVPVGSILDSWVPMDRVRQPPLKPFSASAHPMLEEHRCSAMKLRARAGRYALELGM